MISSELELDVLEIDVLGLMELKLIGELKRGDVHSLKVLVYSAISELLRTKGFGITSGIVDWEDW